MSYYERPLRPDELMHFGIMGMKWGIRRYQNPDGTLTQAGKMRYAKQEYGDISKELDSLDNISSIKAYKDMLTAGKEINNIKVSKNNDERFAKNECGTIVSNANKIFDYCKKTKSKSLKDHYALCKKTADIHDRHMDEKTITFIDKLYEHAINKIEKMSYSKDYKKILEKESIEERKKRRYDLLVLDFLLNSTPVQRTSNQHLIDQQQQMITNMLNQQMFDQTVQNQQMIFQQQQMLNDIMNQQMINQQMMF